MSSDVIFKQITEEYDHLDHSRPIQPPIPHYHRTTSSAMSTLSHRDRESNQSNNKFPFSETSYDAPIPHPKQLNINVPPLPMKNQGNSNLTPSPSSSTASTVTQDENIDAIISVEKPMNKNFLQPADNSTSHVLNEKSRDDTTDWLSKWKFLILKKWFQSKNRLLTFRNDKNPRSRIFSFINIKSPLRYFQRYFFNKT